MIRFQRTIRPRNGKTREAIAWAKEIADYLNTRYEVGRVEVYTQRFGRVGAIYWVVDVADMPALETFASYLQQDSGYHNLLNKGNFLYVDGSVEDLVLKLV